MPHLPDALCAKVQVDTEEFFRGDVAADIMELCRRCPARQPCHDWADAHNEVGYWGGTTERARRRQAVQPEPPPEPPPPDPNLTKRARSFRLRQQQRIARIDPDDILLAVDRGDTLANIADLFNLQSGDVLAVVVPRLLALGWTISQIETRLATNRRQVERYQTGTKAA
jgi:hypothetical protein